MNNNIWQPGGENNPEVSNMEMYRLCAAGIAWDTMEFNDRRDMVIHWHRLDYMLTPQLFLDFAAKASTEMSPAELRRVELMLDNE